MLSFSLSSTTTLHISSSSSSSSHLHQQAFVSPPRSASSPLVVAASAKLAVEHLRHDTDKTSSTASSTKIEESASTKYANDEYLDKEEEDEEEEEEEEDEPSIAGIYVPRQKYISVPKAELLDAILDLFNSKQEAEEFRRFATCLDSFLHAEHKCLLEEMRSYHSVACSKDGHTKNVRFSKKEEEIETRRKHGSSESFEKSGNMGSAESLTQSRITVATRFQNSFMKLLRDAQFEELSTQDLMLTDALNTNYLLTLPVYVDWKKASQSNAIIFRRGYATEKQTGLLIVEKLEYLQSKLLQQVFLSLSIPLKEVSVRIDKGLRSSEAQANQKWIEKVKAWLMEKYYPTSAWSSGESKMQESGQISAGDLPIWIAAQKAVSRYEGFLSPTGPRYRLIRKLLTWIGLFPSIPEASIDLRKESENLENYLRPNFLPRVTLSNIWEPAELEACGYDIWKMLKTAAYILFSQSTLQEPAFEELILLYTDNRRQDETGGGAEFFPLQLKIYEKIPIPDLTVIFPHKKLSFRILDTVRLDIASILGLLAFFINYKFENILSSPSAIMLDAVASIALIIYVTRVVLGYKQTRDRYQLLVNKTLYEKTLASGFGTVHFLLDASEQQQFKEAILVYATLLHHKIYQVSTLSNIKEDCEKFVYDRFKEKIEMPIDKAVETLKRLNLLSEFSIEGNRVLEVLPCSKACETLRQRWNDLIE